MKIFSHKGKRSPKTDGMAPTALIPRHGISLVLRKETLGQAKYTEELWKVLHNAWNNPSAMYIVC